MFSFVALYAGPNDAKAFEDYYRTTHLDIVRGWPGLRAASVTVFSTTPRGGAPAFHLKGEMHFDSREDFMAAMQSDAGAESQVDARRMVEQFAVEVTMLLGETDDVS